MKEVFSKIEKIETICIQYETMQEYEMDKRERMNNGWYESSYASIPMPCITWERKKPSK